MPPADGRAPSRSDELAAARAALYRPEADDATRDRYRRLVAAEEADRPSETVLAEQSGPRDDAGPGGSGGRGRRRAVLVASALLVAVVAAVAWSQQRPAARPASSDEDAAPLVRLITGEPQRLPEAWRDADLITASDVLDGAVPLTAPDGHGRSRLLLVVRCPASDRSFQAAVTSRTAVPVRYGACGRLQTIALPPGLDGPVGVVVTTRGTRAFSGALLQR